MTLAAADFRPRLAARRRRGAFFAVICAAMILFGVVILAVLVAKVFAQGWTFLTPRLLSNFPSTLDPEQGGVKSALYGTLWLIGMTAFFVVPVGVGAAVYLQEYAPRNRLTTFLEVNLSNLAGVPSIVYGILGLAVFVRWFTLGEGVLAGALTLSLMVLPVVIVASRESLLAVPGSMRAAAYALGATRWQTIRAHVIPSAIPGILTGVILAVSRAIGEAAPLIMVGAMGFVTFVPTRLDENFTALPIQIYTWSSEAQPVYHNLAAAAIIVLLGILIPFNAIAIGVRAWRQTKQAW